MSRRAALVLMVLMSTLSCYGRAWTKVDSWYRMLPEYAWEREGWVGLDRTCFWPVGKNSEKEAEAILEARACVEIGSELASRLAGGQVSPAAGRKVFLVRGVYLNEGNGQWSLFVNGQWLHVHHGCLGAFPVPMKRRAIVVQLEQEPSEVFVTVDMAQ